MTVTSHSRVNIILDLEQVIDHCLKGQLVEDRTPHIKPSVQMLTGTLTRVWCVTKINVPFDIPVNNDKLGLGFLPLRE